MEALGLFKRDEEKDWDGPEVRNTRHDSSRFWWLDADVQAHLWDRESNWLQSRRHLAARRSKPALH
jgi:hypothetical protein